MLFTLKAGEALCARMHDPSLFDCAIQRSDCTLFKGEIRGEKPLGVTCKSITYFIHIHCVVRGTCEVKPSKLIQGEDMEIFFLLSPSLKCSMWSPLSGGKA